VVKELDDYRDKNLFMGGNFYEDKENVVGNAEL